MTSEDGTPPEIAGARVAHSALDEPATPARLRALATAGVLDERAFVAALAAIGARPDGASWRRWVDRLLLVLGALLVVAGVVFYIAANWGAVSPHARMVLVAALISGSAGLAARLGLDAMSGRACTLVGGLLVGPLLALYGQTYQTGADAWELFAGWAGLILGFCTVARFPGLWLFWVALIDTTVCLYWDQELGRRVDLEQGLPLALALVAIQVTALAVWEVGRASGAVWMAGRAFARAVATAGIVAIVLPVLVFIVEPRGQTTPMLLMATTIVVAAAALAGLLLVYREWIPDLFMLALDGAAAATIAGVLVGRLIFLDLRLELGGVFLLGIVILGEMWALAHWLRTWRSHPAHATAPEIEA